MSAPQIFRAIEEEFDADLEDIDAAVLADPSAGWPADAARSVKKLVRSADKCLCHPSMRKRLALDCVLLELRRLEESSPTLAHPALGPRPTPPVVGREELRAAAGGAATKESALSIQVRGMQREHGDPEQSVQRNVSVAFDGCLRRLNALYAGARAREPAEFDARINFWYSQCALPEEVRARMQQLRIWRNAALHHDQRRWAREGPRSAADASGHLAALESLICGLENRERGAVVRRG